MDGIKLSNWPFEKGEEAKLIQIGRPFDENGRWCMNTLFLNQAKNKVQKIKTEVGEARLLRNNAIYVDGMYQRTDFDEEILFKINPRYTKLEFVPNKYGQHDFDSYKVTLCCEGRYSVIALFEIVRSVFAPDAFCMHMLTHVDTLSQYFTYRTENQKLIMEFTSNVSKTYLTNEKIMHLAWVYSNEMTIGIINQLYASIIGNMGWKFDYCLNNLEFKARVKNINGASIVNEILEVSGKTINAVDIEIQHPEFVSKEYDGTQTQRPRRVALGKGNLEVDSDLPSSPNSTDYQSVNPVKSVYTKYVPIEKVKNKRKSTEVLSDNKQHYYPDTGKRSTAEPGGRETVTALEFKNINEISDIGSFGKMFEVLNVIKNMQGITMVECEITELRNFRNWGAFITLDDGVTPRKCLIAKINGASKYSVLIDIQLESRSISTLMLVGNRSTISDDIITKVLKGTIRKSGVWPEEMVDMIAGTYHLYVHHISHTATEVNNMAKRIYSKNIC